MHSRACFQYLRIEKVIFKGCVGKMQLAKQ